MDAYPKDYVAHNLPFILVSGLGDSFDHNDSSLEVLYPLLKENGVQIESDFPLLTGSLADDLRSAFRDHDASDAPWNSRGHTSQIAGNGLRVKNISRSYRLPPRKAQPPAGLPTVPLLHSPISPLTPHSPVFPDGLITPLWVTKHQNIVPAVVINVYPLTSDRNMASLRDNQLKIEINGLKSTWASTGYKTRFVIVLVAEGGIPPIEADERLANIRRATNLDPRSVFVVPPDLSPVELRDFVRSLFSTLLPSVGEYYRDLSKHARRKRNRSTIPPPTVPPTSGTSQTLSLQGWNVRYEFKLGIFAEFRHEMDAAHRNYETAYDILFGQDVFESIAGWDPRFNEARLLADTLAIRLIRCLLWNGQTTAAVRLWLAHKARSEDIVSRRGKGMKNYGWEAWESRWSLVMAQLISRAQLPTFSPEALSSGQFANTFFCMPEKSAAANERFQPWELLHHEGYWLERSARHAMRRRLLAEEIPEEDRIPPGQSPASQIANKAYLYDTYLAPEPHIEAPLPGRPGFDHSSEIISSFKAAREHFAVREQIRHVETLSLDIAREYIRIGSWSEAYEVLIPLWPRLTWRVSGWWLLMEEFAWCLRECAFRLAKHETLVWIDWELLNRVFSRKPGWKYDLSKCLADIPVESPKPAVALRAEDVVSCCTFPLSRTMIGGLMEPVSASLVFEKAQGNVGEPLQVQLVVASVAHAESAPLRVSEIKIGFEGSVRPIKLVSQSDEEAPGISRPQISSITLRDPSTSGDSSTILSPTSGLSAMVGLANLTFKPSETKVFNLTCVPREAGDARVASLVFLIEEVNFNLVYTITQVEPNISHWWVESAKGLRKTWISRGRDTRQCKILPKPPKIAIRTPNLRKTYYTNEKVTLQIEIQNDEEEDAQVTMQTRLFTHPESAIKLRWSEDFENTTGAEDDLPASPTESQPHSLVRSLGILARNGQLEIPVNLIDTLEAVDHEIEITVRYYLVSDLETPISKTVTIELPFIRPFEANYDFLPRVHSHPWPDFFYLDDDLVDNETSEPKAAGLQQTWCLDSKVVSFAAEPLVIESAALILLDIQGDAICRISDERLITPKKVEIAPEELRESEFDLDIQKISLDDRRPANVNLTLEIKWRRASSPSNEDHDSTTTSTLAIPRFLVPLGEPRVLASATPSSTLPGLIHLDYTLENPSMHFLTFTLTMEASEHFAFSGAKMKALQLVPLSRHTVRYNLLAFKQGLWIQPQLTVVDTYFNKTLRVLPTDGMRVDKKGILVWVNVES